MKLGVLVALAASLVASGANAAPARIAFVGDSMADGLWGAFFRLTGNQHCSPDELGLIRDAKNGSGLARPDHFDWTAELDGLVKDQAPSLVVASIGLNDRQDLVMPDRTKFRLGTPEWLTRYKQNVADFYAHAGAGGAPVLIIGLPNLRDAAAEKHAEFVNGIFEDVARAQRDVAVTYVTPWRMANDDGSFASYGPDLNGATVQIRAPDGLHFTQAGYDVLGKYLEPAIGTALGDAKIRLSGDCLGQ